MFDWIPWLFSIQAEWGATWGIGFALIGGIGLLLAGGTVATMNHGRENFNDNCVEPCMGAIFFSALCGAFWPMVTIALPFIAVAVGLFCGGMSIANALHKDDDKEEEEASP
jgi:hypothetical protein